MGERKKYLFVCYANENRSPTAEAVCRSMAKEYGLAIEAESAGMSPASNRPVTKATAEEAERIFVMEGDMKTELVRRYGVPAGKIICLNIPDIYPRFDPQLEMILEEELYDYFKEGGLLA